MGNMNSLVVWAVLFFWLLVGGVCIAKADSLTFDCTPVADAVTGAKIQFNEDPPIDVPLVSTCGTDPATKVTCVDPASKTICYPAPIGAFVAKAMVRNVRDSSAYSLPLNVPGIPGSPSLLKTVK